MAREIRNKREAAEKERAEERRKREIRDLKNKITELAKEEQKNLESAKQLARIRIAGAKFAKEKDFVSTSPVIAFAIENTTDKTISRIFCRAVLTSTGRKVPWHRDSFNYSFRGGLNPGEKQNLRLAPNRFSEWGQLENRDDYTLTLTLEKVEDENEKVLWEIKDDVEDELKSCSEQLQKLLVR